jgi:putative lipoprotein (rSAM/lipoprotein system)
MKKINRPLIKGTNWALAGILGLLGFSACENDLLEYGTPFADYTVKGAVVNKADGKPIEGIRIDAITRNPEDWNYSLGKELTTVTNAKGEFKLSNRIDAGDSKLSFSIAITDIDGEKNGSFVSDTLSTNFRDAEHAGKQKNWYEGEYIKTVKVELTEKKVDE